MKAFKILSAVGVLASIFLIYIGYGVQELKASSTTFGTGCSCRIGGDAEIIPVILYSIAAFFLLLSILGLKAASKK